MFKNKLKIDEQFYTRRKYFFEDDGYLKYAEKALEENYWLFTNTINIVKVISCSGWDWRACVELIIEDIVKNRLEEWGFPELWGLEEHALAAISTYLYYSEKQ